ncbi:MAG: nucleotidyltransferase domain-containing protein [bacterium]
MPENREAILESIRRVLLQETSVVFAYLFGSFVKEPAFRDLDIGVYLRPGADPLFTLSDVRMKLSRATGMAADIFDLHLINEVLEKGDLHALLVLGRIIETGILMVDKDFDLRADFIDRYSLKHRENEVLFDEVLL